ncbi:MAG: glutathione peroxidase [candidate division SR1 bacterium]|nr:glutathione peroxidase [candidate division SR1 bacterium]
MSQNIYEFITTSLIGKPINFIDFKDNVILVVNTASQCGLTPQYTGLQKLHETYSNQGLVVIGFPCNQFGGQEPGDSNEISENCLVNYGVTFLMTQKIDVNGLNTDPIFVFLKDSLPGLLGSKDIKWNFGKFLINKKGIPYKRYAPTTEPKDLEKDIIKLLES